MQRKHVYHDGGNMKFAFATITKYVQDVIAEEQIAPHVEWLSALDGKRLAVVRHFVKDRAAEFVLHAFGQLNGAYFDDGNMTAEDYEDGIPVVVMKTYTVAIQGATASVFVGRAGVVFVPPVGGRASVVFSTELTVNVPLENLSIGYAEETVRDDDGHGNEDER